MIARLLVLILVASGALFGGDLRLMSEAEVIVTAADHVHHTPQLLSSDELMVPADMMITRVRCLNGDTDLMILLDGLAGAGFAGEFAELRAFVAAQPASTRVGVASIENGNLRMAVKPGDGRHPAQLALRPSAARYATPYCGLSSLIGAWPSQSEHKEVLLITHGADAATAAGAPCSSAGAAVADAQRAGVVIYSISIPAATDNIIGAAESSELTRVALETGGEAYFFNRQPREGMAAFLGDIAGHIANQYSLTLAVKDVAVPGFRPIWIMPKSGTLELMMPDRVWVNPRADDDEPMPEQ